VHPRVSGVSGRGAAWWLLLSIAAPAWGAADDGGIRRPAGPGAAQRADLAAVDPDPSLDFDIPAQSLASGLDRYAAVAQRPVVFPDELVAGRMSAPVRGRYTPQAALRAMLEGSGLEVDDVSGGRNQAFVLQPAARSAPEPAAPAGREHRRYDGLVQARVWGALCASPRTAPGGYRAVLRFRLDAEGRVRQANLLASSGDGQRDAAMLAVLESLRIDQPPPRTLAQPLILAILPREAMARAPACATVH